MVQIFATGLGATDPPVASTVGGVNAQVLYQDLAPGFVALYQVSISAVGTDGHLLSSKLFRRLLVAQLIDFFSVKQNERDAVVIDASDGAGSVGRPHPHSGMIGAGALVIGDRA